MIAKNKDDTVIIASSSPTIIQKESAESSGASTVVSSSAGSASSVVAATLPVVTNSVAPNSTNLAEADAELVIVDQALYESVRQLPHGAAGQLNVIAVAAAAAIDPQQQLQQQQSHGQQQVNGSVSSSSFQASGQRHQLPTVSTQSTLIEAGLCSGAPPSQPASGHAPLNATNTMKQAPSSAGSGHSSTPSGTTRKSNSTASGKSPLSFYRIMIKPLVCFDGASQLGSSALTNQSPRICRLLQPNR